MSGVTVSSFSAQPGAEGDVEIRIRGINTFGDSNPMVLIDGVEGSLNSVSPNDIENISVLKDAASASIYGVRAANGVVLVTTNEEMQTRRHYLTADPMVYRKLRFYLHILIHGIGLLFIMSRMRQWEM